MDDKRRLQIPAKWRSSDEGQVLTLIAWPSGAVREVCLLALPPERWTDLVNKMTAMPLGDPKADALRRLLGKKSDQVVVDRNGRICLPEKMAEDAGIKDEAILVGCLDSFQIWNPDKYNRTVCPVDEALTDEAFKMI